MATTTKLPELPKKKKNSPSPVKSNSKPKKEAKNIAPQGNDSPNQTNRSKNKKSVLVNSFANIPRFKNKNFYSKKINSRFLHNIYIYNCLLGFSEFFSLLF